MQSVVEKSLAATAINAEALESAFHAFNQHSSVLEESYRELQNQLAELTNELVAARTGRHSELVEKERLAERLAELLETLPGAIVVIDGNGVILDRNNKAAELLDQPLRGCAWSSIVRREFCAGGSADGDLRLNDGRWLNLSRRPLRCERGEILLLTDISESRRTSDLLQRQDRLSSIGEMTASYAHQIRTPLASALLYASKLDRSTDSQRKAADRISDRLGDIGRMVDDMLGFAGGTHRSDVTVRVVDLLEDVAGSIEPQLGDECRFTTTLSDPELTVEANADAVQGALLNLIDNALHACGDDAQIELGAMRSSNQVVLTVTDNGHGIPEEIQARLFDPFFTTRPQGTGLGLAVVRSVVSAHDGEVLFDSGPNGTTFAICLPASPELEREND